VEAAERERTTPPIEVQGLAAGYEDEIVIEVERLAFRRSKITCIMGPSGCGKTTLIRNLLMLERPMRGRILVEGQDLLGEAGEVLQRFRERTGVLFQSAALFNSLTLAQNVAFPIREHARTSPALAREIAVQKLSLVGLSEFVDYLPGAISGGMRKRAGIARALAKDPDYLVLDEPSAGLDPITGAGVDDLILRIRDLFGTTIVVITHEVASLKQIADDAVMLADGRVLASGTLEAVMGSQDPLIRDFFDRRAAQASSEEGTFGGRLGAGARAT
jgi:phospholipid/cholesterol/gamma-HCH transport system ATP-binding protein